MSDTPTLCCESSLSPGFQVCGLPAIGPHPEYGFIRPLCYRHMEIHTAEHHEKMDRLLAEMEDEAT